MLDMFKMASKTTVVTMYFNMRDFPDMNDMVRDKSFYMEKGRATLGLDSPMVIFCDNTCYEDIKTIREGSVTNASDKTTYVIKSLKDYDIYKELFPIIQHNRIGNEIYTCDNRVTSSCSVMYMFKLVALCLAKNMDPYKTSFYAWVDFGGSHIMNGFNEYVPQILANPHPKISFCYIHYRGVDDLSSVASEFSLGYCGIAGTIITIETQYMNKFYTGVMSIFYDMIFHKMIHTEEQALSYLHFRHPELFNIYYGDYYSIAMNYHSIRDNFWTIKYYVIEEALRKGDRPAASAAAKAVLDSIERGTITVTPDELLFLQIIG